MGKNRYIEHITGNLSTTAFRVMQAVPYSVTARVVIAKHLRPHDQMSTEYNSAYERMSGLADPSGASRVVLARGKDSGKAYAPKQNYRLVNKRSLRSRIQRYHSPIPIQGKTEPSEFQKHLGADKYRILSYPFLGIELLHHLLFKKFFDFLALNAVTITNDYFFRKKENAVYSSKNSFQKTHDRAKIWDNSQNPASFNGFQVAVIFTLKFIVWPVFLFVQMATALLKLLDDYFLKYFYTWIFVLAEKALTLFARWFVDTKLYRELLQPAARWIKENILTPAGKWIKENVFPACQWIWDHGLKNALYYITWLPLMLITYLGIYLPTFIFSIFVYGVCRPLYLSLDYFFRVLVGEFLCKRFLWEGCKLKVLIHDWIWQGFCVSIVWNRAIKEFLWESCKLKVLIHDWIWQGFCVSIVWNWAIKACLWEGLCKNILYKATGLESFVNWFSTTKTWQTIKKAAKAVYQFLYTIQPESSLRLEAESAPLFSEGVISKANLTAMYSSNPVVCAIKGQLNEAKALVQQGGLKRVAPDASPVVGDTVGDEQRDASAPLLACEATCESPGADVADDDDEAALEDDGTPHIEGEMVELPDLETLLANAKTYQESCFQMLNHASTNYNVYTRHIAIIDAQRTLREWIGSAFSRTPSAREQLRQDAIKHLPDVLAHFHHNIMMLRHQGQALDFLLQQITFTPNDQRTDAEREKLRKDIKRELQSAAYLVTGLERAHCKLEAWLLAQGEKLSVTLADWLEEQRDELTPDDEAEEKASLSALDDPEALEKRLFSRDTLLRKTTFRLHLMGRLTEEDEESGAHQTKKEQAAQFKRQATLKRFQTHHSTMSRSVRDLQTLHRQLSVSRAATITTPELERSGRILKGSSKHMQQFRFAYNVPVAALHDSLMAPLGTPGFSLSTSKHRFKSVAKSGAHTLKSGKAA